MKRSQFVSRNVILDFCGVAGLKNFIIQNEEEIMKKIQTNLLHPTYERLKKRKK